MEVKIFYDTQEYNSGIIVFSTNRQFGIKYNYDTDIKELLIKVLTELDIEYSEKAIEDEEEE